MRIIEPTAEGRGRFDGLSVLFHWMTVVLVVFQFASGWSFESVEGTVWFAPLLLWHRSTGIALWAVTLLRAVWRKSYARFPAFPANLPWFMAVAAKASETGLYVLLIVQPLSGLMHSLLRGKAFALFGLGVPVLLAKNFAWSERFHEWHEWGAWALAGLVGLHACAALFHHLVLRDDVLEAMWPKLGKKRA